MRFEESLSPGFFRGVPFFIDTSEFGSGRNAVQHEFIDREDSFGEDIGRKASSFSIEGHLIGDDVLEQRDRLIRACSEKGPGVLIHPFFAGQDPIRPRTLSVICTSLNVRQDIREGRFLRFNASFIEEGQNEFPLTANNFRQSVLDQAPVVNESSASFFDNQFSLINQAQEGIDRARNAIETFTSNIDQATSFLSDAENLVASIIGANNSLLGDINNLLFTPQILAGRINDIINLFKNHANFSEQAEAMGEIQSIDLGSSRITTPTPSRQQDKLNIESLENLIRQGAIVVRATASSQRDDFKSIEEAQEERDLVGNLLDEQIDSTEDDDLFQALRDIKAFSFDAIPDPFQDLPSIIEIENKKTRAALLISYEIFESIDQEQDIIDRNNVFHPGFVRGGEEIKVLSRG